jgi:hypothetical protein
MNKVLIFILSGLILFGCKRESLPPVEISFPGYYKATRITSATPADLNNDGLKSNNLYSEISGPFTTPDGHQISFYNFESISNYLEVRPLPNQTNQGKLIAFNFPHQVIDYLGNNIPFLMLYQNEFLNYTYEIRNSNNIYLNNTNPGHTNQIGEISTLIIKGNGDLTVSLKKQVFDFVDKTWQNIDITVEYSKIH